MSDNQTQMPLPAGLPEKMPVQEFIRRALQDGVHPNRVRKLLQEQGIRWKYDFTAYDREQCRRVSFQGNRERNRRRSQFAICESCQEPIIETDPSRDPRDRNPRMCDACLEAKWRA